MYRHSGRRCSHPLTTPVTAKFLHGLCFFLSFLIISYFHVVLGEVVPKNLAIAKADRLAALTAPRAADLLSRHGGLRGGDRTLGRRPSRTRCT